MATVISLVCIAVLTAADQLIKYFVVTDLKPVGSADFIDGFVGWHYLQNTGAAFGSFSRNTVLLTVITGIVIAGGLYAIIAKKIKSKAYLVCAVMIISGGLGNLIDRIIRGFVVDFIELKFVNFAVFNFADILVTGGAAMLIAYMIYDILKGKKDKHEGEKVE